MKKKAVFKRESGKLHVAKLICRAANNNFNDPRNK